MHFTKRGDAYQVSWISGPRHNLLALTLNESETSETVIGALPPIGECRHQKLDEERILVNVLEGIKTANQTFDTKFSVSKVEYAENDTGPEEIFSYLAKQIVEHIVKDEIFVENA